MRRAARRALLSTCGAALCAAILTAAPAARAANQGADALFEEGLKLFDAGRTHEACERFEASLRLDPALGTLQNLATCHEQDGRTAKAQAEFLELSDRAAKAGVGQKARELLGRQRAAALAKKLSKIELRLPPGTVLSEILVDDAPLDRSLWFAPVALDPGPHTLTFSSPGKVPARQQINVSVNPGVEPVTVPLLADVPTQAPPPPPRGIPLRTVGIAVGGAGALSLLLGAVFGGLTFSEKSAAAPHCTGQYCDAEGLSIQDTAHRYAAASTATLVIGVAAVGAGGFLFFWGGREPRTALRLTPSLSAGGGGMRVDGTW